MIPRRLSMARCSFVSTPMAEEPLGTPAADVVTADGAGAGFQFRQAIVQMVQRGASDLLLKVGRPPTVRINGQLVLLPMPPLRAEELKALAETLMTPRQLHDFSDSKEADFGIGVPGIGRFRTNVFHQRGTLSFALRAIPYEVRNIRDLLLPGVLEEIALRPRGLVLVTGVTGSGKSTALAAMIDHINRLRRVNIITIEDPIEFLHRDQLANVSQREVGSDTLSFEGALRHVHRLLETDLGRALDPGARHQQYQARRDRTHGPDFTAAG